MEPRAALQELFRTDDVYNIGVSTTVLPYAGKHLTIARRPPTPKDIGTLRSTSAAAMINDPFRWIIKSNEEALADIDSGKEILHKSGPLAWRTYVRARTSAFFVAKRDGVTRRLVIDARVPNSLHRRPPKASLATPTNLAALNFSAEALDLQELVHVQLHDDLGDELPDSELRVPPDEDDSACGSSIDLCDDFYQAKAEQVASWFGLDFVPTTEGIKLEFGLDKVLILDEATGGWSELADGE